MNDALHPAHLLDMSALDPDPQALGCRVASQLQSDMRGNGQTSLSFIKKLHSAMQFTSMSSRIAIHWFIKQFVVYLMNGMIGGHLHDLPSCWEILSVAFDVVVKLDDKSLNRELLKALSDVALYRSAVFDSSRQACAAFMQTCTDDIFAEEFKRLNQNANLSLAWRLMSLFPSKAPSWDALHVLIDLDRSSDVTFILNNICDIYARGAKPEKNLAAIPLLLWDRLRASNISASASHSAPVFSIIFYHEITDDSILSARKKLGENRNLLSFLYVLLATLTKFPNAVQAVYSKFVGRLSVTLSSVALASSAFVDAASVLSIFAVFVGEFQVSNTVCILRLWIQNHFDDLSYLYLLIDGVVNVTAMIQSANRPAGYFTRIQELYGILHSTIRDHPSACDHFRSRLKFVLTRRCSLACFHILGPWYLDAISYSASSSGPVSVLLSQNLSLISDSVDVIQNGDHGLEDARQLTPIWTAVLGKLLVWIQSAACLDDAGIDEICSVFAKLCSMCFRFGDKHVLKTATELLSCHQTCVASRRPRVRLILPSILARMTDLRCFVVELRIKEFMLLRLYVNSLFEVYEPACSMEFRERLLDLRDHSQFEILSNLISLELSSLEGWLQQRVHLFDDILLLVTSCYKRSRAHDRQMAFWEIFLQILPVCRLIPGDIKPEQRHAVGVTTAQMLANLVQSCSEIVYFRNNSQYFHLLCNFLLETADSINQSQKYISSVFDAFAQVEFLSDRRVNKSTFDVFHRYLLHVSADDWTKCFDFLFSRGRGDFIEFVFQRILLPILSNAIVTGYDCVGAHRGRKVLEMFCSLRFSQFDYCHIICTICRILKKQVYQYLHSYSVVAMHALSLQFLSRHVTSFPDHSSDPDAVRWVISLCLDDFRLISLKFAEHFPIKYNSTMADKSALASELNANRMAVNDYGDLMVTKLSQQPISCPSNLISDSGNISNSSCFTSLWGVIPTLVSMIFNTLYAYRRMWQDSHAILSYLRKTVSLCKEHLQIDNDNTVEGSAYANFFSSFVEFCTSLPIEIENYATLSEFVDLRKDSVSTPLLLINHLV